MREGLSGNRFRRATGRIDKLRDVALSLGAERRCCGKNYAFILPCVQFFQCVLAKPDDVVCCFEKAHKEIRDAEKT